MSNFKIYNGDSLEVLSDMEEVADCIAINEFYKPKDVFKNPYICLCCVDIAETAKNIDMFADNSEFKDVFIFKSQYSRIG